MGCRTVRVSDPLWGADGPSVVAGAIVCIHLLFCSQGSVHLSREGVCLPSMTLTARFAPSVVTLTAFNSFPIAVIKYLTNNNKNNKLLGDGGSFLARGLGVQPIVSGKTEAALPCGGRCLRLLTYIWMD